MCVGPTNPKSFLINQGLLCQVLFDSTFIRVKHRCSWTLRNEIWTYCNAKQHVINLRVSVELQLRYWTLIRRKLVILRRKCQYVRMLTHKNPRAFPYLLGLLWGVCCTNRCCIYWRTFSLLCFALTLLGWVECVFPDTICSYFQNSWVVSFHYLQEFGLQCSNGYKHYEMQVSGKLDAMLNLDFSSLYNYCKCYRFRKVS